MEAFRIVERGEFKKEEIEKLCKLIKESPLGQKSMMDKPEFVNARVIKFENVFNTIDEKITLKKEVEETRKLEVQRTAEKSKEKVTERGMRIDRGFGMGR